VLNQFQFVVVLVALTFAEPVALVALGHEGPAPQWYQVVVCAALAAAFASLIITALLGTSQTQQADRESPGRP